MLLRDSLEAAFHHRPFCGPHPVADWGDRVCRMIQEAFPGQERMQTVISGIAADVLWELTYNSRCDEIAHQILVRPDAFFKSLLTVHEQRRRQSDTLLQEAPSLN